MFHFDEFSETNLVIHDIFFREGFGKNRNLLSCIRAQEFLSLTGNRFYFATSFHSLTFHV